MSTAEVILSYFTYNFFEGARAMKLSNGEKLILVMLSEVYKHLKIDGEINPELVMTSIFRDQTWGLKWEYGSIFNDEEENPRVVDETCDILNMYRILTASFDKLSKTEKARVQTEADPWGDYIKFRGFDGNHDPHFGVVGYLVKSLERYDELNAVELNSHSSTTLPHYRDMLVVYKPIVDSIPHLHNGLSADQIIKILKAGDGD